VQNGEPVIVVGTVPYSVPLEDQAGEGNTRESDRARGRQGGIGVVGRTEVKRSRLISVSVREIVGPGFSVVVKEEKGRVRYNEEEVTRMEHKIKARGVGHGER
jgi:hypothetical protein